MEVLVHNIVSVLNAIKLFTLKYLILFYIDLPP